MNEPDALNVVAVRALETADTGRALASDADRTWASRAAAEVVGADAAPDAFLARRAALALERIGERYPALPQAVRALRWRPWVGTAVVAAAFVLGAFLDQIDTAQRVNVLAPPVLGLLVWNVAGRSELAFVDLASGRTRPGPALPAEVVSSIATSLPSLATYSGSSPRCWQHRW